MNHRIFERTLRSLVFRGACLFEYHGILNLQYFFKKSVEGLDLEALCWLCIESAPLKCISVNHYGSLRCDNYLRRGREVLIQVRASNRPSWDNYIELLISNQVGLPAELKHINKRRKRN